MSKPSMVEDVINSAKEQVADRFSSPIIVSFILSWCIWNYKFIVILFSDATVSRTFELIDTVAFPSVLALIFKGAVFPAISAFIYIFIYPYPAKYVYGFSRRRQKEILELRQQIEKETPLTIEDSRKIRNEIIDNDLKHKEAIDKLNLELVRLNELANQKGNLVKSNTQLNESTEFEPESSQIKLLELIHNTGGNHYLEFLIAKNQLVNNMAPIKTKFDLDELERWGLLEGKYNEDSEEYGYDFTHEGRRALLKFMEEQVEEDEISTAITKRKLINLRKPLTS